MNHLVSRRVAHLVLLLAGFGFTYVLHELELPFPRRRRRPLDDAVARMEMPRHTWM